MHLLLSRAVSSLSENSDTHCRMKSNSSIIPFGSFILHNMIIRFKKQCGISGDKDDTENWALGSEGSDLIPPAQLEDFDIDEVGDTSFEGTTGHQAHAQLMEYLLG